MSGPELHRGKLARHPRILSISPLTPDDLACLREARVQPRLKTLRRSHHRVARLIALGYRDGEVARLTGYSIGRIGSLKASPAIQELIAQYDKKAEVDWLDKVDHIHEEMTEIKLRGLNLISERLEAAEDDEAPTPIALKDLVNLVGEMADRTGHGKHSSKTVENLNFAEMMKQLARGSGKSNVIDANASPVALASPSGPAQPPGLVDPEEELEEPVAPLDLSVVGFRRRA